jgi:hypothetical protein
MVGTEELSRLTQSELLFAFTNKIPKIDLVDNPEGFILGGGGIIYYTPAVTKMPVFYMDLVFFREYYKEFMAANSTPLRRQAAVDEFLAKLYEVHEIYRGIVDKANRLHYVVTFNGIVADESNYNFQTKTMRIPLCCYFEGNTTLKNLVEYVNGSSKCTGSASVDATMAIWAEYILNYSSLMTFDIPMDIDAAENLIAATRAAPARIQFIIKNTALVQNRCRTTQRTSMGIRVLGMRLIVKMEKEEISYICSNML